MTSSTDLMLYLVVGFPVAVVALYLLVVLGPLGWFAVAFLVLGGMVLNSLAEGGERGDNGPPARRNCPACGAPNPLEREACRHCGDVL